MKTTRFGIEIEMTGITRQRAAKAAASVLGGRVEHTGTYYDTWEVKALDGRIWKFASDGSIETRPKKTESSHLLQTSTTSRWSADSLLRKLPDTLQQSSEP